MKKLFAIAVLVCGAGSVAAQCQYRQVRAQYQRTTQGGRTTVEVLNLGGGNYEKAVWIALRFDNNVWIQLGYWNYGKKPSPVSMCFDYDPGESCQNLPVVGLNIWPQVLPPGMTSFSIYNVGGTWWELAINDISYSRIDVGATTSVYIEIATEQTYSCHRSHFPTVRFYPAIETYDGSVWAGAPSALSQDAGDVWGIAGILQNSSLRNNEVLMGSSIPQIASLELLWNQ